MNNAIRNLKPRLEPIGIHIQKLPNDEFYVAYIANGKGSYILVSMHPAAKKATLSSGETNKLHRQKGVATALRALAMYILHAGGYRQVYHLGINGESLAPSGAPPYSTHLVRKYLGFKKSATSKENNNEMFYYSNWVPTPNTLRLLGSTMAKSYANMQKASQGRNLTFSGNVRNYIPKKNGPPKNSPKKNGPPKNSPKKNNGQK
jgi:hypothetical protein